MASGFGTVKTHTKQRVTSKYNLVTVAVISNHDALFEVIERHGSTLGLEQMHATLEFDLICHLMTDSSSFQ